MQEHFFVSKTPNKCAVYATIYSQQNIWHFFFIVPRHGGNHNYSKPVVCERELSTPLTYQEKIQLKSDLDKLPCDKHHDLLRIVNCRETSPPEYVLGEVELNLEMYKTTTLRALQRFVALYLSKCNSGGKSTYTLSEYLINF